MFIYLLFFEEIKSDFIHYKGPICDLCNFFFQSDKSYIRNKCISILLDLLVCSIMEYFYKLCRFLTTK